MSDPVLSNLAIGSIVQVANSENTAKYMTRLIGVDPDKLIITTLPASKQLGLSAEDFRHVFGENSTFILRILGSGLVYGFKSRVINYDNNHKLLFSSYPDSIQSRNLRKETRYPCTLASVLQLDGGLINGMVTNISASGCQFCVTSNGETDLEERLKAYSQSRSVNIDIHFPFNEEDTRIIAAIKSIARKESGALQIGMAFDDQPQGVKMFLDALHLDAISSFFSE